MKRSREEIQKDVLKLLRELADDWEYDGEITRDTYFLANMGFESLDVVVLGTAVQEQYGQVLPFTELFVEIGQREVRDITVGEWVDFIHEHLDETPSHEAEDRAKS